MNWRISVTSSVILDSQNAFLPGWQITDCALLANEFIDVMRKVGLPRISCKVDMKKAYDHVNWGLTELDH